jgi:Raf kinase inhibitor-like YbhB/YbcL family protein
MNNWVLPSVVSIGALLVGSMIFLNINAGWKNQMTLGSLAFENNEVLPKNYTKDDDAKNWSPDLTWSNVPEGAQSFVLICDDPDAPRTEPFVHWLMFNIKGDARSLPENIGKDEAVMLDGKIIAQQSKNDFGEIGYDGPRPPVGHQPKNGDGYHHYIFTLYALKQLLNFDAGKQIGKHDLLQAMQGLVLAKGQLVGKYQR